MAVINAVIYISTLNLYITIAMHFFVGFYKLTKFSLFIKYIPINIFNFHCYRYVNYINH